MAGRTLGLDIETSAIKAVLLERSFRGQARVAQAFSVALSPADDPGQALREIIAALGDKPFRLVASLPLSSLTVRRLKLPFQDRRKIAEVLPFELATILPSAPGEGALDFFLTGTGLPQDVTAVIANSSAVKARIDFLKSVGLEKAILEGDGLILAAQLGPYIDREGLTVILDGKETETITLWLNQGDFVQTQILPLSFFASSGEPSQEDLERLADRLFEMEALLRLRGLAAGGIVKVYLSGRAAGSAAGEERLSKILGVTVEPLDLARRAQIKIASEAASDWIPGLMDLALALAMRTTEGLDFARAGKEGKSSPQSVGLKKITVLMAILLALIAAEALIDYQMVRKHNFALRAEVADLFRRHYPPGGRPVDPVSQMRSLIDQLKKEQTSPGDAPGAGGVLSLLQELSALIPAEPEMRLHSFSLEEDNVSIRGETRDFESVEKIREALAKSPRFASVNLGAVNLRKDGRSVAFDLTFKVAR